MKVYLLFFLVLVISYVAGVLGFCRMIGAIRMKREDRKQTVRTWGAILLALVLLVLLLFRNYLLACGFGLLIALAQALKAGRNISPETQEKPPVSARETAEPDPESKTPENSAPENGTPESETPENDEIYYNNIEEQQED